MSRLPLFRGELEIGIEAARIRAGAEFDDLGRCRRRRERNLQGLPHIDQRVGEFGDMRVACSGAREGKWDVQRRSNICVVYRAVGPFAWRGGKRNWMPLSVSTVWIL